jgi:hypothetical protein
LVMGNTLKNEQTGESHFNESKRSGEEYKKMILAMINKELNKKTK